MTVCSECGGNVPDQWRSILADVGDPVCSDGCLTAAIEACIDGQIEADRLGD